MKGLTDMPMKPLKICNHVGCNQLTKDARCQEHEQEHQSEANKRVSNNRQSYHMWYSSTRWRKLRLIWLKSNPLCVYCQEQNKLIPAQVVDHIRPHKGDIYMFYSVDNLQSLCKRCHDIKTASIDGGYGNK